LQPPWGKSYFDLGAYKTSGGRLITKEWVPQKKSNPGDWHGHTPWNFGEAAFEVKTDF